MALASPDLAPRTLSIRQQIRVGGTKMFKAPTKALVAALVLGLGATAHAESDDAVVQKIGHGEVNWSAKTVTATGSGAANLKDASVAVARLNAERAAKLDAYRN